MSEISRHKINVSASSPRVIVHYLLEYGIPESDIQSLIHTELEALESPDFRLDIDKYFDLWAFALSQTGQEDLGLSLGTRLNDDEVGLLGHIFFSNATIEKALSQYQRYFSVTNEAMTVSIEREEKMVHVRFHCSVDELYCIQDIERTLAAGVSRTREQLGQKLPIEKISFIHQEPRYKDRYSEVFACPVFFAQEHTEIVIDEKYLSYRLPGRSSYLQKLITRHLETLMRKISRKDKLSDRVRALVSKRLARDSIDAEHIAKKLNMSRNTLYRKLSTEEVSFHELVEDVRKSKAIRYMESGKYSLSEITFLLGFSELSAFSRAFKRWTGSSPAKYKEQYRDDNRQT